jgi:DNA modification methylase
MGRLDYEYQHEPILFTWTKTHKRFKAGPFQTSVWSVDKPRASPDHPTMKPVELPVNAILNHTEIGDIVYEPFSGSGTDIVACEQTQRRCRAIEISPGYVAVAIERWHMMTGKEPKLL